MIAEFPQTFIECSDMIQAGQGNPVRPVGSKQLGGLVLARQVGESIRIGDSIVIEVLALKTSTARLRISAPRSVAVHRREVYDAIRLALPPNPIATESTHGAADEPDTDDRTRGGGLVLTRKAGQTLMIGDEIAVDVVEARPGVVRLRIIAPRSVAVHRTEVYESIRQSLLA